MEQNQVATVSNVAFQRVEKHIKIYYQNVNGIKSDEKLEKIRKKLEKHDFDIIALTETKFVRGQPYDVLDSKKYKILRHEREFQKGGGVLLGIKKGYSPVEVKCQEHKETLKDFCQITCAKVVINGLIILVTVLYIVPGSLLQQYKTVYKILSGYPFLKNYVFIIGDFNLKTFSDSKHPYKTRVHTKFGLVTDFCNRLNLKSYNDIRNKSKNRLLDLIFSDVPNDIKVTRHEALSKEDPHHPPLLVTFKLTNKDELFSLGKFIGGIYRHYIRSLKKMIECPSIHNPHPKVNNAAISYFFENIVQQSFNLKKAGKTIFPVVPSLVRDLHLPNIISEIKKGMHWSLLCFKKENYHFYHFDSLQGTNYREAENLARIVYNWPGAKHRLITEKKCSNKIYESGEFLIHMTKELIANILLFDECEVDKNFFISKISG